VSKKNLNLFLSVYSLFYCESAKKSISQLFVESLPIFTTFENLIRLIFCEHCGKIKQTFDNLFSDLFRFIFGKKVGRNWFLQVCLNFYQLSCKLLMQGGFICIRGIKTK